jgi:hypothetical protein
MCVCVCAHSCCALWRALCGCCVVVVAGRHDYYRFSGCFVCGARQRARPPLVVGRSCGCSTGEKKAETRNAKLNVLRCPLPPGPQSAQLDARQATHFGSGEETPTQLDARAKGGRAGKGSSKPGAENPGQPRDESKR